MIAHTYILSGHIQTDTFFSVGRSYWHVAWCKRISMIMLRNPMLKNRQSVTQSKREHILQRRQSKRSSSKGKNYPLSRKSREKKKKTKKKKKQKQKKK